MQCTAGLPMSPESVEKEIKLHCKITNIRSTSITDDVMNNASNEIEVILLNLPYNVDPTYRRFLHFHIA